MTYAQAAELTWPQLLHALGVEPPTDRDDPADEIAAKQDEIFQRIAARRQCLAIELWRLPVEDLMREVGMEMGDQQLSQNVLLSSLRRFAAMNSITNSL